MVWRVADKQQETSKNPDLIPTDETTDLTTSHLTNPASEKLLDGHPKDAGQVIDETTSHLTKAASGQVIGYGYSHSTDETPSHSTRLSKNGNQVAGYAALRKKFLAYI